MANYEDSTVEKFFIQAFLGISPNIGKEIAFRSGIDPSGRITDLTKKQKQFLWEGFIPVISEIEQKAEPVIIYLGRKMVDFSTVNLHYLRADHRCETAHLFQKCLSRIILNGIKRYVLKHGPPICANSLKY